MAETLLPAFNGTIDLRAAYSFTQDQVYDFLEDVMRNPTAYAIGGGQIEELSRIKTEIVRLSLPSGPEYLESVPEQHIRRIENPAWPERKEPVQVARFRVERKWHNGLPFWSPIDLLGLFLSSLGPAPAGATKRTFFLPLVAVYGKWCAAITQPPRPWVFQCTWNTAGEFFLGASQGGHYSDKAITGTWRHVWKHARFRLLNDEPFKLAGWGYNYSPSILQRGLREGSNFGACGETYPFLTLLKNRQQEKGDVYGVALNKRFLEAQQYEDGLSGSVWRSVWDPCVNCKALIRLYGGNEGNFAASAGSAGAPA